MEEKDFKVGETVLFTTRRGNIIEVTIHHKDNDNNRMAWVTYNHQIVGAVVFPAVYRKMKKIQMELF